MNNDDINEMFDMLSDLKKDNSLAVNFSKEKSDINDKNECKHSVVEKYKGTDICVECGKEIFSNTNSEFEQRFNIDKLSRLSSNVEVKKNIYKHLDKIKNLPLDVRESANNEYCEKFTASIHRGSKLLGIIFAIVFNKVKNKGITVDQIISDLKINRKIASDGKKEYIAVIGKNKNRKYTTALDYISEFESKCNHTIDSEKLKQIYETIKGKYQIVNSSTPRSLCAAIIYYLLHDKIDIDTYSDNVKLSKITIGKLFLHIKEIKL